MINLFPWLVIIPLAWASAAFVAGPGRGGRLAIAALALQLALVLGIAFAAGGGATPVHQVGGWGAPLGIDLAADGLSVAMLLLTQGVALPLALYARSYFSADPDGVRYFWPLTGYLLAGMNALFLSTDLFNLYVTLELVGLAAVGLVASKNKVGSVAAALRYLLAALGASGAYLFGVVLMYVTYGSVGLSVLTPLVRSNAPFAVSLAAGLMLLGLLLKTALFPLHFWLPAAHGNAPAPVSALLSALVIKASFYLIVRLWFGLFAPIASATAANLLGLLGSAAILWGSLMALRQSRLKMLVAYSTVAQVGYLFLIFPIAHNAAAAAHGAFQATLLQALSHGLAKSAMFAAAGAMVMAAGRGDIAHLAGMSSHQPLSLFTFALAGVTLMGLPPSSAFLAKWLLIDSAIVAGQWVWIVVLIGGGLLTAAYVFKVLRYAFCRVELIPSFRTVPAMLEWAPFALACASFALGLRATELLALLLIPP